MELRGKILKVLILVSIATLLVAFPTYSQGSKSQFSDEDLKAVAERIINDTISEEEFRSLNLSEEEMWRLLRWVIIVQGYSEEEADRMIEHLREESARWEGTALSPLGACDQMVEEEAGANQVSCNGVFESWTCDGDNSDRDYLFEFIMSWYGDPDLIRWWTDDWWIRHVFELVYDGGNLLGRSLCSLPKYLCIGEGGVTAAGGPTRVKNNLRLRHN